ncbi:HAD-like domain-containing protein [Mycena leptocephala]|nr:HAD-like domain-containing protein [Mycena leptocephala]
MSVRLSSVADYETLLDKYDTWMFDCDGVLWHGDRLIDGAVDVLDLLRSRSMSFSGKATFIPHLDMWRREKVLSSRTTPPNPGKVTREFDQLGVEAHVDEIYGSAYAAAVYISSVIKLPKDKKVYEGVSSSRNGPSRLHSRALFLGHFTLDPDVAAVVCGLDTNINYTKMSKAFQYLTRNQADSTYPAGDGLLPGAGAISAPLRYALGKDPISIGSPPARCLTASKRSTVNFDPKRTLMINGITTEAEITGPNASSIVPDFVTQSIGDLRAVPH